MGPAFLSLAPEATHRSEVPALPGGAMRPVASWGRLVAAPHEVVAAGDPARIAGILASVPKPALAHGMGRSYGDACLNPGGALVLTTGLDRFIAFDETTGCLACEAGMLLRDIQRLAVPRGWTLPVTPGTQLVTVGGAIANDVHGKNQHRAGSFGDHITRIHLVRTDGEAIECGPDREEGWFRATVGGAGLTGLIARAEIRLRRTPGPWLEAETIPYDNVGEFFRLADESEGGWEHTVSWVDCTAGSSGRGLFMRANPVAREDGREPRARTRAVPFTPPLSLVNRLSLRAFNAAYFRAGSRRRGRRIVHHEAFLYPLDNLRDWNRMYGPKGFYQYQCVLPRAAGQAAVEAMLDEVGRSGDGSFLTVLKTFGDREPPGLMSFPLPGVTLALDFPNRGEATERLFQRLDAIVRGARGRLYLAKDARMPRDLFEAGYPNLGEFLGYRDPGISSGLSRRLMGY